MRILTIGDEESLVNYANDRANELRAGFVRHETNFHTDPIQAKIVEAGRAKVHTTLAIGARHMEAGVVSVRLHGKGPQGAQPKAKVIADILAAIRERQAQNGARSVALRIRVKAGAR